MRLIYTSENVEGTLGLDVYMASFPGQAGWPGNEASAYICVLNDESCLHYVGTLVCVHQPISDIIVISCYLTAI